METTEVRIVPSRNEGQIIIQVVVGTHVHNFHASDSTPIKRAVVLALDSCFCHLAAKEITAFWEGNKE